MIWTANFNGVISHFKNVLKKLNSFKNQIQVDLNEQNFSVLPY
jgi:hypothetical protein